MNILSKKKILIILSLIILLNIIIRIPITPHEIGLDSFYNHWMIGSIIENEKALWVIHPTSLFGFYPYSYPSFVIYFTSILTTMLSISIEHTVLILCFILGVLGVLFSYLFVKELTNNDWTTILSSFLFSLSPLFLSFTQWTNSTRHLALTMMPLFLFCLVRFENKKEYRYLLLSFLIFIVGVMSHRVFWVIGVFSMLSYICVKGYYFLRRLKILNHNKLFWIIIIFLLISIILQFSNIEFFTTNIYPYSDGFFFKIDPSLRYNIDAKPILAFNFIVDYVSSIGLILIISGMGFILLLKKLREKESSFNELFIIILITSTFFLLTFGTYIRFLYLPLCVYLGSDLIIKLTTQGSFKIKKYINIISFNQNIGIILFSCFMIISLVFSLFMVNNWLSSTRSFEQENWIEEHTISLINFLNDATNNRVITSDITLNKRLSSELIKSPFPVRKDTRVFDYEDESVEDHIGPLRMITEDRNHFWKPDPNFIYEDWLKLLYSDNKEFEEIINRYGLKFIVENKNSNFVSKDSKWSRYQEIYSENCKIYDNSEEEVWCLLS